ncbi:Protein ECT2 [Microtus ochrogaster]|uniref:Protein ECT2 n=1 Tax=Microtus ochrogaster TaxID=79684 RepID=A0A8J6GB95_MICOH|nr:Protein ECT2 [Microtus ochrogaster]
MVDNSALTSPTEITNLADSSIFDSKVTETSKENLCMVSSSNVDEEMPQVETRLILVQEAGKQEELLKAVKTVKIMEVPVIKIKESCPGKSDEKLIKGVTNMEIKVPCVKMDSMEEFGSLDSPEFENVFVVTDFQNSVFNDLRKTDCRIVGPPVILSCAQKGEPLPFSCRPLYCTSMLNLVLCFTGFRKKEELVAVSLGTPIVKPEWIYKAWERRDEQCFCADVDDFRNEFKVPPFQDCILSFLGFSDEEKNSMEEMTEMQGGSCLPVGDERCTHLIVEENAVKELPFEPSKKLFVVKQEASNSSEISQFQQYDNFSAEWFWGSIQMDARAGETMYLYEKTNTPELKKSVSLLSLSTPNSNRKRRRLRETLAQLSRETDLSPFPPRKRPSAEHSLSIGSLLDISNTPESSIHYGETPKSCTKSSRSSTPVPPKQSARWQVARELYQTESNYVNILATIIQLFQVPLEEEGQRGGPILAPEEIKTIFGSIPDIFDVHMKIKDDLEDLIVNWDESKSIGDVFLKYSKDLVKTYPPFVNFFEMSKETIIKCEKQKPRFHAFLKANLLSSHRSLVQRVETVSLGECPCDRGEQVTLFLFNDCLEIARKRHKVIGTFRSPHDRTRPPASLKHIHLMPLSQIKKVLDIRETEDCHNAFALLVRPPTEQANVLLSFQMTSEELPKADWLKMLCRHVANTICKADAENLMYVADPESFEVNTKDMDSTLSRASRAIKKTSKKVTRAFSFSKTPKRALRMALSSSHSSEGRSPPSSGKLAVSRLSSTSSLALGDAAAVKASSSCLQSLPTDIWADDAGNSAPGKDLGEGLDMRKVFPFVSGFGMYHNKQWVDEGETSPANC